jgi:hypothetical protein
MTHWIRAATLVAVTLSAAPMAVAGADAGSRVPRQVADERAPKDCTRFNGRYGYYGNPWCTPEEQARWDRWDAQRLKARSGVTRP